MAEELDKKDLKGLESPKRIEAFCSQSKNKDNSDNIDVDYRRSTNFFDERVYKDSSKNKGCTVVPACQNSNLYKHSESLFSGSRSLDYYFGTNRVGKNNSIPLLDELDSFEFFSEKRKKMSADENLDEDVGNHDREIKSELENKGLEKAQSCGSLIIEVDKQSNEYTQDYFNESIDCRESEHEQKCDNFFKNWSCTESTVTRLNTKNTIVENIYRKYSGCDFSADYFVYTDGACINNGRRDARAGIGVYFGEHDERNVSKSVLGKQSNNTAELGAALEAYHIIRSDILNGKKVGIVTDSEYVLKCVGSYGDKCSKNNWIEDIPNKYIVKSLYNLASEFSSQTRFYHIRSHTNKTDVHSVGNEGADVLANRAIGLEGGCFKKRLKKIYLSVPYIEKDFVKKMGANWDIKKKKWFVYANNPHICVLMEKYCKE